MKTETTAGRGLGVTVEAVDALLPQTQCGQCGYAACRPYAVAMRAGVAPINRCPPGGESTMHALAGLLGRPPLTLAPSCGVHKPPQVVEIDEAACIGCTKCLPACPVDAIVGAAKRLHTVIAAVCTGCELCLPPCPVDCIVVRPLPSADPAPARQRDLAAERRRRFERHQRRYARRAADDSPAHGGAAQPAAAMNRAAMQAEIRDAVARVRARRHRGARKDSPGR